MPGLTRMRGGNEGYRYDRAACWPANCRGQCASKGKGQSILGVSLRLRQNIHRLRERSTRGQNHFLLMPPKRDEADFAPHSWGNQQTKENPRACGMVRNAPTLHQRSKRVVSSLWWAGNLGLRTMGRFRDVPCRHGTSPNAATLSRPYRQQRKLRAWQLPVGDTARTGTQPLFD